MNLKEMLDSTVRVYPDKTAVAFGPQRVSFRQLDEASSRVANALIGLGAKKGEHVAILMSYTPQWIINYFGVVKAGGTAVILNAILKAPEYDSLLRDSDSTMLLTESNFSQMLSSVLPTLPLLKHVVETDGDAYARMLAEASPSAPAVDIGDDDEGAIIYTSGVLGRQKGVVHTHSSLLAAATIIGPGLDQGPDDVVIGMIPFFYALGLAVVAFISLMKGSTMVILPRFTPTNVLEAVQQEKATMLVGVPAMFNALAMMDEATLKNYDLSTLRLALTAGAKASAHLMETLEQKFGLRLCEVYGTTEALATTFCDVRNRKLGMAGYPVEDIRIIDADGKDVPRGEIGEIICRSPQVMKHYYNAPELTDQILKEGGWFHTGDLVRMDEDGCIEYIEKRSFIIVTSAGTKIPPTEVEDLLLKHPSVAEAAYVGVNDQLGGQIPTLFVVLKEGQSATRQELRSFLSQSLADFKMPRKIEFIDAIPKTGSGKMNRRVLKETGAP
jgi:long-chain acyl-CoA synthetase